MTGLRSRAPLIRGLLMATLLAACVPTASGAPTAAPTEGAVLPATTVPPAFGLTWGLVRNVQLPGVAFAIPSNLPTAPTGPGTAGHPGHFGGQSIIRDVGVSGDRLVGVGYTAVQGNWTADAWTSTNGTDWSLAPIDGSVGSFAVAISAGAAGFVVGGRAGSAPAAWSSPDGVAWARASVARLATGARAGEPERIECIIATKDGFLAGGSAGPELGDRQARFWRSSDGATWTPIPDSGAFEGGEVVSITGFEKGYVAVGRLGTGQRSTGSVVWLSADGTTWRRIDDPALATGLVAAVATSPAGLLAVGSDLDVREAVAWRSADGATWTRAPRETSRLHSGEKVRMKDVVVTDAGDLGIGDFVGLQFGDATSWLSTDGLTWQQAPLQPALGQGEPEAVIAWRDRLVMVGSRGAPDNYIPTVWISPNAP